MYGFRWHRTTDLQSRGLYTGDFSNMYTCIPQEELIQSISVVTKWAFDWAASKLQLRSGQLVCIRYEKSQCTWIASKNGSYGTKWSALTYDVITQWARFVVTNTLLKHGDSIYRQTIGIPMGTNCGPVLANLYLLRYEYEFITRLVEKGANGVNMAKCFHMSFRYIDDTLSVDNPLWAAAVSEPAENDGLYPRALTLNQTNSGHPELAEFLGVSIQDAGSKFRLSVFDKRTTFPFHVRRYPLMCSLIPRNIPYGVFQGLLHRGYRICSRVNDFVSFASDVATRLLANGCVLSKLKAIFKAFVANNVHKFFKMKSMDINKQFCEMLGSS